MNPVTQLHRVTPRKQRSAVGPAAKHVMTPVQVGELIPFTSHKRIMLFRCDSPMTVKGINRFFLQY